MPQRPWAALPGRGYPRRGLLAIAGAGLLAPTLAASAPPAQAVTPVPTPTVRGTEVLIDGSSFASYRALEASWRYRYPWGPDHNGSARMYASADDHSQVSLADGVLTLTATRIGADEGVSASPPYLPIRYHSGAVHARQQVLVDAEYPVWTVQGRFQVTATKGSWPAFWLTAVHGWPPECDILEYKGGPRNWFNAYKNPAGDWSSSIVPVDTAQAWHDYRAVLSMVNSSDVQIQYFLDGSLLATQRGARFVGRPLWLILNLQMEGSSGSPGPDGDTHFRARDILLTRGIG